jgi:hypothetical protein
VRISFGILVSDVHDQHFPRLPHRIAAIATRTRSSGSLKWSPLSAASARSISKHHRCRIQSFVTKFQEYSGLHLSFLRRNDFRRRRSLRLFWFLYFPCRHYIAVGKQACVAV